MPLPGLHSWLAAYKDFLVLWKDADPDIPIRKEAKAEYAKLQQPRFFFCAISQLTFLSCPT
jgi:hypothetical protein